MGDKSLILAAVRSAVGRGDRGGLRGVIIVAALTVATVTPLAWTGRAGASVTLTNFAARAEGSTIVVSWETGTEMDTAGFHVRRGLTPVAAAHTVVSGFIPATGTSVVGDVYRWVDAKVERDVSYYYSLQERALDQSVTDYPQVVCARLDGARCDAAPPSPSARPPTSRPPAPTVGAGSATSTPAPPTLRATAGPGPTARPGGRASSTPRPGARATEAPASGAPPAATTSLLGPVRTAVGHTAQGVATPTMARAGVGSGSTDAGSSLRAMVAPSTGTSVDPTPMAASPGLAGVGAATVGAGEAAGLGEVVEGTSDAWGDTSPGASTSAGDRGHAAPTDGGAPDPYRPDPATGRPGSDRNEGPGQDPGRAQPLVLGLAVLLFAGLAWRVGRLLRRAG